MRRRASSQPSLFETDAAELDRMPVGRSISADVTPEVLRWARETAGLELSTVARRFPKIQFWENGLQTPSITQLETLSEIYGRPLVTFFLPSPPTEPPLPTDFRSLPHPDAGKLSRKTLVAIRTARRVQRLYAGLARDLNEAQPASLPRLSFPGDPEQQALRIRRLLAIPDDAQRAWKDSYSAWREWRRAVEALGVLVLQLTIPTREVRGFSFVDGPVPTITVSSSDMIMARMFTLFHELGHLLVATGGVCLPDVMSATNGHDVEPFCNRFSGALLLPLETLKADEAIQDVERIASDSDLESVMAQLAQRYKVSRWVVLFRMVVAGLVARQRAQHFIERWSKSQAPQLRGGPVPRATRVLSQYGTPFVSMVLEAHARNLISTSDVTNYLSVKVGHLPKLHRQISERRG